MGVDKSAQIQGLWIESAESATTLIFQSCSRRKHRDAQKGYDKTQTHTSYNKI